MSLGRVRDQFLSAPWPDAEPQRGRAAAAAAKSLQSCPTLCDPIDKQPTRLPRPWDSPGKNTGVGCHFLLRCMKVKSEREVAQSCPTLSDPMEYSLPGSSIHGIFQARVLEWGAIAFSSEGEQPPEFICVHAQPCLLSMGCWFVTTFTSPSLVLIKR